MIIMINGAFGVGKTSVAQALCQELDNSIIFDPEEVGFMLRNMIPDKWKQLEAPTGDFQDLELWRILTVRIAKEMNAQYQKNLIVPMTIHNKSYFKYIYNGFSQMDKVFHFCLMARKETIHARLIERGEDESNWCFQQTQKCLDAYKDPCFKVFIDTDHATISEIVKEIMDKVHHDFKHDTLNQVQ